MPGASFILFEDSHLLAVNKPAGWNTHAPSPFAGEGVYEWLKHREPRWSTLAILHRLDKETSGVLVFGKTALTNKALTAQFTGREIRKTYLLLTDRSVDHARITAVSRIVRAGERYVSRPNAAGGDTAETCFERLSSHDGRTLVQARPVTGRTHQIRVHAAEHGFPILGDVLYGGAPAGRVYLHASKITLRHPATDELVTFEAPCDWLVGESKLPPSAGIRSACVPAQETNAFRLVHGASDGFPGLYVDKLGEYLLAQSAEPLSEARQATLRALGQAHQSRGAYHKLLTRHVRGASSTDLSPQLVLGEAAPEEFEIVENGLRFGMSFAEGYSVGLFLDQRDNRRRWLTNHVGAEFGPIVAKSAAPAEILNTFAYTCGFSLAAAQGGMRVTSVDLSRKYLEWGKRNFSRNAIDGAQHDFIYGDTFEWLRRLGKKGRRYEAIALDPPTFSHSKESGVWQAEKHLGKLVQSALLLLKEGGVLFVSTNAARLEPEAFMEVLHASAKSSGRPIVRSHYVPQPPDFPVSREEPAYLKTAWLRL